MSIQDESFPHDELFELDLSVSPNPRFQFPHRLRQQQQQSQSQSQKRSEESRSEEQYREDQHVEDQNEQTAAGGTEPIIIDDRVVSSAESLNKLQTATVYSKTNSSDPTGLAADHSKHTSAPMERGRKSLSYQDIHTEYTKRRYKHVESKVGQYIANIRSEDEKRRKSLKCQQHRSLPETFEHGGGGITLQRFNSSTDANKLNESSGSDTMDNSIILITTGTSATLSTQSGSRSASSGDRAEEHHCSDDTGSGTNASSATDFVDKQTYALLIDEKERIQSYNDYLQLKLDEKMGENMRLKQNVDFMRVRLSAVEDQLKKQQQQQQQQQQQTGRFTVGAVTSNYNNASGVWGAGRQSLQTLLYCAAKTTTATQTESSEWRISAVPPLPPPPPPPPSPSPLNLGLPHEELYITPDTPDPNNVLFERSGAGYTKSTAGDDTSGAKSVAAIQPISLNFSHFTDDGSGEKRRSNDGGALRRRSNSNTQQQQHRQHQQQQQQQRCKKPNSSSGKSQQSSRSSHPSSGDSAIEVEVIELSSSPRRNRRKRYSSPPPLPPPPTQASEEVYGDDRRLVSYVPQGPNHRNHLNSGALVPTVRCSSSPLAQLSSGHNTTEMLDLSHVVAGSGMRGARKHSTKRSGRSGVDNGSISGGSLRRRWLRFFRGCLPCSDPQPRRTLDNSALQQTYTQIPLLEASFIENCREHRRVM